MPLVGDRECPEVIVCVAENTCTEGLISARQSRRADGDAALVRVPLHVSCPQVQVP